MGGLLLVVENEGMRVCRITFNRTFTLGRVNRRRSSISENSNVDFGEKVFRAAKRERGVDMDSGISRFALFLPAKPYRLRSFSHGQNDVD